jgi:hypothetical protein
VSGGSLIKIPEIELIAERPKNQIEICPIMGYIPINPNHKKKDPAKKTNPNGIEPTGRQTAGYLRTDPNNPQYQKAVKRINDVLDKN